MRFLTAILSIAGALGAGCSFIQEIPSMLGIEEHEEQEKGGKKTFSGRSYVSETRVDPVPQLSPSGFDAERVWSGYDDWEPAVAADPSSNLVYQMTTRYGNPECPTCSDPAIILRRSLDSGATWEADSYFIASDVAQFDPQVEVATDGTVFAVYMLNYLPGITFSRSTDRGLTWSKPARVVTSGRPKWGDKPILAISQDGRDVYVGYNASLPYASASHDGGQTFARAVQTSNDNRYWFHYAGAVAPNKAAYFVAIDYSQTYRGDHHINVIRSTDGGRTWVTTRVDSSAEMPDCPWSEGCEFGFLGATAGLAVDPAGTLMVAYTSGQIAGQPQQLYFRTSTDGINFSPRKQLSVPANEVLNLFPVVAAGRVPGDFRVAWMDDRNGSTTSFNTWYTRTRDGGATWDDDIRLSDQAGGAPYKDAQGYDFTYGDYFEMAVDASGRTHALWGEGSSYTGPGGTWYTRGQ